MRNDRGKAYMDRLRAVVADIRQNENAVLQARLASADGTGKRLGWASIATLLGVLLLGAFSALDMRRRMNQIDAAQQAAGRNECRPAR